MHKFLLISLFLQSTFSFAAAGSCGGNFTNQLSGTISSPGYPTPGYEFGLECIWKITVQPGSKINLTFTEVNIKSTGGGDSGCGENHVQVNYPGLLTDLKYCTQNQQPSTVESTGNEMEIKFVSTKNETDRSRGFSATFTAILPPTIAPTTTTTNATTTTKNTTTSTTTKTAPTTPRTTTSTKAAPTEAPKKGISKGGVAAICIVVILLVLLIIDLILYQKNMGVIYTIKKSCCGGYAEVSKS